MTTFFDIDLKNYKLGFKKVIVGNHTPVCVMSLYFGIVSHPWFDELFICYGRFSM